MRDPGARAPPYGTRAGRGRARRRLRADRHDGPGVRDARELARGRPERPLRAASTSRAARCSRRRPRRSELDRHDGQGTWRPRRRAGPAACAASPRSSASCRCPRSPRRSRRQAKGQVRALITVAGQPAGLDAERRAARAGGRRARLHGQHRHLRQRDDAATRTWSCRRPTRSPARTTTSRSTSSPRAMWRTTRRPCSSGRRACIEKSEVFLRLTGIVTGQGPDADPDAIDDAVAGALSPREVGNADGAIEGRDPAEILGRAGAAARARADPRPDAPRRRPRRRLRRPAGRTDSGAPGVEPAWDRPRRARVAASGRAADSLRQDRARARADHARRRPRSGRGSTRERGTAPGRRWS